MVISASAFQRVIAERDHDACTICPVRGTLAAAAPSMLAG